ncbi:MAG: aldo/keto reductase [Gaiellaceae bacterium]
MATRLPTTTLVADLSVQRIGFGGMRITGTGIWGEPPDREAAREVVREAVRLGVDHVDTADSYGPDVSEEIVAEALHPYPEGLVLATKGGYLRDGPFQWRADGRPERLREACEGSLRRLRLDTIPLYYFHVPDPAVPFEESIGALAELRDEGKIFHVGVSNVDLAQLRRAQAIVPIAAVQNHYNLAEREHEDVLRACEEEGIAFVPWFPLSKGALADGRSRELKRIATEHDATPAQVALAWLLHRSSAILPIPGTGDLAHLRENVAAVEIELTGEELASLERFRAPGKRIPQPLREVAKRVIRAVRRR